MTMRLAQSRQTTQTERIFALEEARKTDSVRLDSIETKVVEMHEILTSVRTIGRFLRRVTYWFGGPSAVGAAALYGWHTFTGH